MTNWTNEQQNIFNTEGNILVSASAGSGKTTVMVKKITDCLLKNVPIESVLVLSYTIASAGDMRAKIIDELYRYAKNGVDDQGNALDTEQIKKQIDSIPFSDISTVDGFCSHLIKENFESLRIDASFKQLDNEEANLIKRNIIDDLLNCQYEQGDIEYLKLVARLSTLISDDSIADTVLKLYDNIYINPNPNEFIDKIKKRIMLGARDAEYENLIVNFYKNIAAEYKVALEKAVIGIDFSKIKPQKEWIGTLFEQLAIIESIKSIKDVESAINSMPAKRKPPNTEDVLDIDTLEAVSTLRAAIKKLNDDLKKNCCVDYSSCDLVEGANLINELLYLVSEFKIRYDEFKLRENKLDFLDLSQKAIELLSDETTCTEIKKRFSFIFVDEYQDINPLQEAILQKISSGNNVFMVGDSKQSIYAFRNADTKIFLDKIADYKQNCLKGTNRKLTQNFRSQGKILKFVDKLFGVIMTEDTSGLDYKTECKFISDDDDFIDNGGHDVEINLYYIGDEIEKCATNGIYSVKNHLETVSDEKKAAYYEGKCIAKKIKEIVGYYTVNSKQGLKKAQFSDIAILFRSRSDGAEQLLRALRDNNIPYISDGFDKDVGEGNKKILVNLIRVIDNQYIDIAFAGYLLSYFGGLDENELNEIRKNTDVNLSIYDATKLIANGEGLLAEKCHKALSQISDWRFKASYMSINTLLNEIIAESGFDAYVLSKPDGRAEYYYLTCFIASLSGKKASESTGNFLRYFDKLKRPTSLDIKLDYGNAVHIMTIHGSKGLEFPIVFACQINAKPNKSSSRGDVVIDRDLGIGIKLFNTENRTKINSLAYTAIEINRTKKNIAEGIRLFYVAMTRAKEMLFLSGTVKENKKMKIPYCSSLYNAESFLDYVTYVATRDQSIKFALGELIECPKINIPIELLPTIVFNEAEPAYTKAIDKVLSYRYKHSEATKLSPKYTVTELNKTEEDSSAYVPHLYSVDARAKGIAYHTVMENIDFSLNTYGEVEQSVGNMVAQGILMQEEANLVDLTEILDCICQPLIKEGIKGKYFREKSFMLNLPANEVMDTASLDKVLIQGTIDLLFLGNENIIVDYKNSTLMSSNLREKYKKQLEIYILAVETTFGVKIDKKYLYSFREKKFIEL
ncbi:MAG: UvrD-helicase domain-containing protein [Clostridia bacterium]